MEFKVFLLTLLAACTVNAFYLPTNTNKAGVLLRAGRPGPDEVAPLQDFGPTVKPVIDGLLASLAENPIPIEDLIGFEIPEIIISLEEVLKDVIGENQTSPIKGTLTLRKLAVGLRPGAVCDSALVNLNSVVQPIALDIVVSIPGAGLMAEYDIDALLLGIVPVRGSGPMYAGLDIKAGIVDSAFKTKLGSGVGSFTKFDYLLELRSILIKMEGLLGGPEISDQINKLLNNIINESITPVIAGALTTLKVIIRPAIHDVLNEAVKDITYQQIYDLLNPPKP